jgi:DnaJ-class molecular chaperone
MKSLEASRLVQCEPDEVDLFFASHDSLPRCPFCGGQAMTTAQQNDKSLNFVATVFCTECQAKVFQCQRDRVRARDEAIAKWTKRV